MSLIKPPILALALAATLAACSIGNNNPNVAVPHVDQSSYVGAPGSTAP